MNTILIAGATLVNEGKRFNADLLVKDGYIERITPEGQLAAIAADHRIEAAGKYLLPGVIDDQVHFREPGLTHKGDLYHESRAAVAGGVTSFMEMPNTKPQTITQERLEEKFALAATRSLANYSFYIGATNNNLEELLKTDPGTVCGIKIFMGSSTGDMLVDNPETLRAIFSLSPMLIAVHCEDENTIRRNTEAAINRFGEDIPVYFHPVIRDAEACYLSSALAVDLARQYGTRLHILHLSTARELSLLDAGIPLRDKKITAEVCVHHLLFDADDYHILGNLIKWNPAVKSANDKKALLSALLEDRIDVVATDHAPHTLEEKKQTYLKAPSGGPLVQHSLTAMLQMASLGALSVETVVNKMCHAPATLFGIEKRGFIREGYFADLVIVDPAASWTVSQENILYKCGWSPLAGRTFHHRVTHTLVNGRLVYDNGSFRDDRKGMRLTFKK